MNDLLPGMTFLVASFASFLTRFLSFLLVDETVLMRLPARDNFGDLATTAVVDGGESTVNVVVLDCGEPSEKFFVDFEPPCALPNMLVAPTFFDRFMEAIDAACFIFVGVRTDADLNTLPFGDIADSELFFSCRCAL